MPVRRAFLLFCLAQLLSPVSLTAAEGKEIDFLISKGQGLQNKAFQAGPDERKRHLRGAIREYEKIFYLAPDKELAYILAGSCYEHLGELQMAAETYALGAERVVARNRKLMLLSNVARVYTNTRNLQGVADVIAQMENLDPRAIEIAAAGRGMAMDGADEQTRSRYARKCASICDYHLQNGNTEIRKQAANLKQGLEIHSDPGETPGSAAARRYPSDPWKELHADAGRGEYEKVVVRHQNMLAAAERLDPLSKSYVNPVPSYRPYLDALFEILQQDRPVGRFLRRRAESDPSADRNPGRSISPSRGCCAPARSQYLSCIIPHRLPAMGLQEAFPRSSPPAAVALRNQRARTACSVGKR